MSPLIKTCSCGCSYTREQWKELRHVGVQEIPGNESLDLRDCATCRSTMAVPVAVLS